MTQRPNPESKNPPVEYRVLALKKFVIVNAIKVFSLEAYEFFDMIFSKCQFCTRVTDGHPVFDFSVHFYALKHPIICVSSICSSSGFYYSFNFIFHRFCNIEPCRHHPTFFQASFHNISLKAYYWAIELSSSVLGKKKAVNTVTVGIYAGFILRKSLLASVQVFALR